MLTKTWNPDLGRHDVTFDLPGDLEIAEAYVVGDFNGWDETADPMRPDDEGRMTATIALDPGTYRFRYHLGGGEWENDWSADDYVPNEHGGADSVVRVPEAPTAPPAAKKSPARKGAAVERGAAKKAAPKRAAAKKAAGKKASAKKTSVKKPAAKKVTAKQSEES